MKISDAKHIPLEKLVEALGGRYSHKDKNGELWYFSPFRPEEATASFKINEVKKAWHDFGHSQTISHPNQKNGGDIIDLWCDYHFKDRRLGVKEALKALEEFNPIALRGEHLQQLHSKEMPSVQIKLPRYKILKISNSIVYSGLKDELHRRRISLKLANLYLQQGYILDTATTKKYNGFLFENDKGGYEVSIPNPTKQQCFKTCIGPKASSRILASDEANSADIFEGFWDMLSWFEMRNMLVPRNHTYSLNSTSLVSETCQKIINFKENIEYVFLFMDNDNAGYEATHSIAAILDEEKFKVGSCEQIYKNCKDLNEFWASSQ